MANVAGITETHPVASIANGVLVVAARSVQRIALLGSHHLPAEEVVTNGKSDSLHPSLLRQAQPGVEHPPTILPVRVGRDMHLPQHVVVEIPGIRNEQRVRDPSPREAVLGDGVRDEIVVR